MFPNTILKTIPSTFETFKTNTGNILITPMITSRKPSNEVTVAMEPLIKMAIANPVKIIMVPTIHFCTLLLFLYGLLFKIISFNEILETPKIGIIVLRTAMITPLIKAAIKELIGISRLSPSVLPNIAVAINHSSPYKQPIPNKQAASPPVIP